jgi:hypothetical protein
MDVRMDEWIFDVCTPVPMLLPWLSLTHRLQATALKKHLLELKIERITQTGIDQMPSPPPSPTAEATMMR